MAIEVQGMSHTKTEGRQTKIDLLQPMISVDMVVRVSLMASSQLEVEGFQDTPEAHPLDR